MTLKAIWTSLTAGKLWNKSMDYTKQLELVHSYHIKLGQSLRTDCPACEGRYTFSITNVAGQLLWHCFRASCSMSGSSQTTLSKTQIVNLTKTIEDQVFDKSWEIPAHFQPIKTLIEGTQLKTYMEKHNLVEAWRCDLVDFYMDPQMGRLVFVNVEGNRPLTGIGKALQSDVLPKWYKYTKSDRPFIVNRGSDVGVIVEDVPSAITVALGGFGGVCLMGTKLLPEHIPHLLRNFKRLIVCLDKDATALALEIQKRLDYILPTKVAMLSLDLKWFRPDQIAHQIRDGL